MACSARTCAKAEGFVLLRNPYAGDIFKRLSKHEYAIVRAVVNRDSQIKDNNRGKIYESRNRK